MKILSSTVLLAFTIITVTRGVAQSLVLDPSFNAGSGVGSGVIERMVIQPDGRLLCAGGIEEYNGVTRDHLIRLLPDGALDMAFTPEFGDTASSQLFDVFLQSDGKILVAGWFDSMNGVPLFSYGRLMPDGTNDPGFMHSSVGIAMSIAVSTNGNVFVGGPFSSPWASLLVRTSTGASVTSNFAVETPFCMVVQPDGRVLAGGNSEVKRFWPDGSLDTTFQVSLSGQWPSVQDMVLHTDGRVLIVGDFTHVDGLSRNGIARLLPNGAVDTSFDPGLGFGGNWHPTVDTLSGGRYLASTFVQEYNGQPTLGCLVQLHSDGTLETSYASDNVIDILTIHGDTVYVTGPGASFGSSSDYGLHRLVPDAATALHTVEPDKMVARVVQDGDALRVVWDAMMHGEIALLDGSGREVHRLPVNAQEVRLGIGRLAPGAYVVRFTTTEGCIAAWPYSHR